eukprot:7681331-Lingulodinium_polyedra.AAC.1
MVARFPRLPVELRTNGPGGPMQELRRGHACVGNVVVPLSQRRDGPDGVSVRSCRSDRSSRGKFCHGPHAAG